MPQRPSLRRRASAVVAASLAVALVPSVALAAKPVTSLSATCSLGATSTVTWHNEPARIASVQEVFLTSAGDLAGVATFPVTPAMKSGSLTEPTPSIAGTPATLSAHLFDAKGNAIQSVTVACS